jgi:hypothetical protein
LFAAEPGRRPPTGSIIARPRQGSLPQSGGIWLMLTDEQFQALGGVL